MRVGAEDGNLFNAAMREAETLSEAFVARMTTIEATPREGLYILATSLAHILVASALGKEGNAMGLLTRCMDDVEQMLPSFCTLYRQQFLGEAAP